MAEDQGVAVDQVGLDRLGVDVALDLVGREDDDDVSLLDRLGDTEDPQALLLGLGPALGSLEESDADVDAGVAQVERVRVPLAAVADDRHMAALDDAQICVVVVKQFSHGGILLEVFSLLACRERHEGCGR